MPEVSTNRSTTLLPMSTRVVELGESVATAIAGRFLQRMGATVTCVVGPDGVSELDAAGPSIGEGPFRSATAVWLREGKQRIELDWQDASGRERLLELITTADVILISGTTQSWRERGLDLDSVCRSAAQAVVGHITNWGDSGPSSTARGGELLAQAAGGLMKLVGRLDREPVRLGGNPVAAITGFLALDGVLIGLYHRQSTGRGSAFSTSLFESTAHLEWKIASSRQAGRPPELRGDDGGAVVVKTLDGHFGLFFTPVHWKGVKALIADPRLDDERFASTAGRSAHQVELTEIVEATTRSMSKKELYRRAQEKGIPAGHVATMSDLLTSPQYRTRDFFQTITVDGLGSGEIPDVPWQILTLADVPERSGE